MFRSLQSRKGRRRDVRVERFAVRMIGSSAAIVFFLVGCEDNSPPTQSGTGNIAVVISGLPSNVDAAVTVTGGQNFSRTMTQSQTLSDVAAGTYQVTAAAVTVGSEQYTPTPLTQQAVVGNGSTANVSVSYSPPAAVSLAVQQVVQGLTNPVYLTAPAGDSRLFIVEQPGRIRIVKSGALLATPFLDITSRVVGGGERGLLSMAFDPQYATNGRFYVYYTGAQGDIIVDRHTVSPDADVANTAAERVITIEHRQATNHKGGLVMFGPDGMLYLATGDGGGGGDPQNNGQNINSLLGKILRLDVSSLPYTIPAGNPFAGQSGADEIWGYGLRNPWRFAFDAQASPAQLYIADVGQNNWEEVNVANAATAGLNYGWRTMEGTHCFNPSSGCNTSGLTLPVLEYDHSQGCSITGGFVYRGAAIPSLAGHYFYSDYCDGWLRSFRMSGGAAVDRREWSIGNIGNVLSFGVDGAGELYVLSANGRVYRIVTATAHRN